MKLSPILARYLSTQKKLSLPGLGTFHANSAYDPNVDYSKKGTSLMNVSFEQEKVDHFDEALIDFISKETGKMKVLAKADISSELEGAIDFINTGKPYYFSGIGTLTKKMNGSFEFHKEKYHHTEREKKKPEPITEKNTVPQSYIDESRKPRKTKPAAIIGTLAIVALAATIGFYIKNNVQSSSHIEEIPPITNKATDSSASVQSDSVASLQRPAGTFYKYVLEVAKQPRASKRYSQLKNIKWPVEIETSDSVNYRLFIQLPAANTDTTRVKDSLSALSGRKVWIER